MKFLKTIEKTISTAEYFFLGVILIICSLVLFAEIVLRYLFLSPLFWSEELVRYSIIWMVFIGGSVVIKRGGHIAVDVLPIFLPPKAKKILQRFIPLISIYFCLLLFYYSWVHMLRIKSAGQITAAMEAPMWIMYLAVPMGALMMGIRWALVFISQWSVVEEVSPSKEGLS